MDMLLLLQETLGDGKQIYLDKIHDNEPGQDGLRTWHAVARIGSYKSGRLTRRPVLERTVNLLSLWS